jgi:hypothetical protein
VLAEIYKEWPEDCVTPNFREKNINEVVKLDAFVNKISGMKKYIFPECAFGPNAIKQLVMSHMRERRRRKVLSRLYNNTSSAGDTATESEIESSGIDSC